VKAFAVKPTPGSDMRLAAHLVVGAHIARCVYGTTLLTK
jgi:hypothetical protein